MVKAWSVLLGLVVCGPAFGQTIYKCTSRDGVIDYSQQSCGPKQVEVRLKAISDPVRLRAEAEKNQRLGVRPFQRECHLAQERVNDIDQRIYEIQQEIQSLGPAYYRASKNAKGVNSRAAILKRKRAKEASVVAEEALRPRADNSARVVCDFGRTMYERQTGAISSTKQNSP